jgi:hypothetical protein
MEHPTKPDVNNETGSNAEQSQWGAIQTDVVRNKYVGWVEQFHRETQQTQTSKTGFVV